MEHALKITLLGWFCIFMCTLFFWMTASTSRGQYLGDNQSMHGKTSDVFFCPCGRPAKDWTFSVATLVRLPACLYSNSNKNIRMRSFHPYCCWQVLLTGQLEYPSTMNYNIDPMQKGMSLFLSYTSMNKMNSLHHVKEHPKISNFLQFESHSSKSFKVRAILDLRDLYGNNIEGLTSLDSNFCNLYDWFFNREKILVSFKRSCPN